MMKLNPTTLAAVALGLLSTTACSGGADPGDEANTRGLVASLELESGMKAEFYAADDGDMAITASAEKSSLEQLESFEQFTEAGQSGLSAAELYEQFAGETVDPGGGLTAGGQPT